MRRATKLVARALEKKAPKARRTRKMHLLALALTFLPTALAQGNAPPKALIVDWDMNPPVVLSSLMDRLKKAGFQPLYRQFYPRVTSADLEGSSVLILLSGGAPGSLNYGMNPGDVTPVVEFVRKGGTLVLGAAPGSPSDDLGDRERYLFNLILNRLKVPIKISDDWIVDEENSFPAPLWKSPWVMPIPGSPATNGVKGPLPFDRSSSLEVGEGVKALVTSYYSSHPYHDPHSKGSKVLAAEARSSAGKVLVLSRYVLTLGGGNSKEPASPLIPLREERELEKFLDALILWLKRSDYLEAFLGEPFPPPARPPFEIREAPLRKAPPPLIREVGAWKSPPPKKGGVLSPSHAWILEEGIRSGWAHMDKEEGELARLAKGMISSGMNIFWGVGHPQVLIGVWGSEEERMRLLSSWERLDFFLRFTGVKWLLGVNFPGGSSRRDLPSYAVGANGESTTAPSPWDKTIWNREIIPSLRVAAQWAKNHPSMVGVVIDLEMYGRRPLFFGNGVDFGEEPFRRFLESIGEPKDSRGFTLRPEERFEWLMESGLLETYYAFLEKRAQDIGRSLREEVRSIQPDWIIGCYMAGILHRWFYRGLLKGLTERGKPVLLFTFQRDVERDLEELRAQGIEAVHVRGLLMGMMRKQDYEGLFRDSLLRHGGYWLNRLTSIVASRGFYPIESPPDMGWEEAWRTIEEANAKAMAKKMEVVRSTLGGKLLQGAPVLEKKSRLERGRGE